MRCSALRVWPDPLDGGEVPTMPPSSDALSAARIGSGDAHMEPSHPKSQSREAGTARV